MIINVKDYHETVDGANYYNAILKAMDAASSGDVVYFPEGAYRVAVPVSSDLGLIRLKSDITLKGEGSASRIKCAAERPAGNLAPLAWLFYGEGVSDLTVRDLAITSTNKVATACDEAIRIVGTQEKPCYNVLVDSCEMSGFRVAGFASRGGRRVDGSGVLTSLRVANCSIDTIGRMTGGDPDTVFGVGINANGWDNIDLVHNKITNVGSLRYHWGIYCVESRFATVANNTIKDCSGGIAWTGIDAVQGREAVMITNNTIDLTRDAASPATDELPFEGSRIGLQLRGNNSDTPLQVIVEKNTLRMANIQVSAQHSLIAGNTVDLEDLPGGVGIWVGWVYWEARNVLVTDNHVRAKSTICDKADPAPTIGILVTTGSEIAVTDNVIARTCLGVVCGPSAYAGNPPIPVQRSLIARNRIRDVKGVHFIQLDSFDGTEVEGNICRDGGHISRAIQVGDANVKRANRSLLIHKNQIHGNVTGLAFGVVAPAVDQPLPREFLIERNLTTVPVANWPPACPPVSSQAMFAEGDVLRNNMLTDDWLDPASHPATDCERSGLLFGAANVKRQLRAHKVESTLLEYPVLGGTEFSAPLTSPCDVFVARVDVPPGVPQTCEVSETDNASDIAFLSYGFVGQIITIHATGGLVWIRDQSEIPEGNIKLRGDSSFHMKDGESIRLERLTDRWQELDRTPPP